jgi:methionine-rich copper-binding protein CopC
VTANTTYVASYYAPNGHYASSDGYFVNPVVNGPLTALADGTDGVNGVYIYGSGGGFPTLAYQKSNYWVDVIFTTDSAPDTTPPTVTSKQPAANATGVAASTKITATFSEPLQSGTASIAVKDAGGTDVIGVTTYDAPTQTVTFTPTVTLADNTTYGVTVSGAKDVAGNTMVATSWSFTTATPPPPDTTPPTISGQTPATGATGVATSSPVSATFSEPVQASTAVIALSGPGGTAVPGTQSPTSGTSQTITFTPTAALTASTAYTVNVSGAKDAAGNVMAPVSWGFTTGAAAGTPVSIWASTATPSVLADSDTAATEVGVKFRTAAAGKITGIRFYKGPGNTGTHVGTLWSKAGAELAKVTFTGETASGWQQATFSTPVSVAANTTYVASYNAPSGHYSVNESYFTAAVTNGPLTALKNGTDGVNGVYRYGTRAFPSTGFKSSNYWVDVLFTS